MHESEHRGERWQSRAAMLFIALVALAAVYLLIRYAFSILLPFLIAWGVGLIIHPLAVRVHRRWGAPMKLCAVVLVLLTLTLLAMLLLAAADRLLGEVQRLLQWLETDGVGLGERLAEWIGQMRRITERVPWLARLRRVEGLEQMLDRVDELVGDLMRQTLSELSTKIPEWIGTVVRAVPSILIFLVVTLVACFYFSADLTAVHAALAGCLPRQVRERLPAWKKRLGEILRQYARAYLLILLITFLELYIALLILGVDYAFLMAALTALVDILPVFGVGIILIPWAVVLLISKQFYVGFGLLITYAIVMVVRQIVEPRVVSGSLGLHPLLTLFCMYVGYRLFGILGMMLAPAAAIVLAGRQSSSRSGA